MRRRWWPWALGVLLVLALVLGGVAWANWQHRELLCADALARRQAIYREWASMGADVAENMVGADLRADLARYCG